jgi:hypothetical protein
MTKKLVFPAVCILFSLICALPALTQRNVQVLSNAVWSDPIQADTSAPLRSYPAQTVGHISSHALLHPKLQKLRASGQLAGRALGSPVGRLGPTVGLSIEGISIDPGAASSINCANVIGGQLAPPDTNMAVGDTQVVQWVNICYSVYDKSTGALIAGPFAGNQFWSGFGGVCAVNNDGDIIIQWDKANHVWVASQGVFGPFTTCIAISKTADATGAYTRYAFSQPGFPDYPKWGLTPNVYYQTANNFGTGAGYTGVTVCAYDGAAMRAGSKRAKQVCIVDNSNGTLFDDSMVPADTDQDPATSGPPPEVLLGSIDNTLTGSSVYEYVFNVSFKGKGKATLAGVNGSMPITVPQFTIGVCNNGGLTTACVPQPSAGSDLLDTLGDRLMYRLALFDDGTNQHFVINHTVTNTSAMAARWYEFTAPSGSTSLSLAQSGETPNDGEYRWMGSIARDKFGDIALGYSRSSAAAGDYPSIYLSGQTAGESAGTTDAEVLAWAGSGSQIATADRWGDYSSMSLDAADHCTFWYTNEYYPFDGSFQWYTHMVSLKFPSCP